MIYLYIQAMFVIFYESGSILSMTNHHDEKEES